MTRSEKWFWRKPISYSGVVCKETRPWWTVGLKFDRIQSVDSRPRILPNRHRDEMVAHLSHVLDPPGTLRQIEALDLGGDPQYHMMDTGKFI